jgi:hypothetical protein
MPLIAREDVFPLNRQVQLGDLSASDYPEWVTGEEKAVFTAQMVAVATQGELDGDVRVELWTEPVGQELTGEEVLETEIQLVGDVVRFGNTVAGDVHDVSLPRGSYRVRVLVSPTNDPPSMVRFILDPS